MSSADETISTLGAIAAAVKHDPASLTVEDWATLADIFSSAKEQAYHHWKNRRQQQQQQEQNENEELQDDNSEALIQTPSSENPLSLVAWIAKILFDATTTAAGQPHQQQQIPMRFEFLALLCSVAVDSASFFVPSVVQTAALHTGIAVAECCSSTRLDGDAAIDFARNASTVMLFVVGVLSDFEPPSRSQNNDGDDDRDESASKKNNTNALLSALRMQFAAAILAGTDPHALFDKRRRVLDRPQVAAFVDAASDFLERHSQQMPVVSETLVAYLDAVAEHSASSTTSSSKSPSPVKKQQPQEQQQQEPNASPVAAHQEEQQQHSHVTSTADIAALRSAALALLHQDEFEPPAPPSNYTRANQGRADFEREQRRQQSSPAVRRQHIAHHEEGGTVDDAVSDAMHQLLEAAARFEAVSSALKQSNRPAIGASHPAEARRSIPESAVRQTFSRLHNQTQSILDNLAEQTRAAEYENESLQLAMRAIRNEEQRGSNICRSPPLGSSTSAADELYAAAHGDGCSNELSPASRAAWMEFYQQQQQQTRARPQQQQEEVQMPSPRAMQPARLSPLRASPRRATAEEQQQHHQQQPAPAVNNMMQARINLLEKQLADSELRHRMEKEDWERIEHARQQQLESVLNRRSQAHFGISDLIF